MFVPLTIQLVCGKMPDMGADGFEKHFYSTFGKVLGELRRKRKISQEMLADEVGLTRTSITNIEKGRQPVQLHTLYLMARLLSVDIKDLLPSPQIIDQSREIEGLTVSRSEWLEQMNVKLPGGTGDGKTKRLGKRSKTITAE